MKFLLVMKVCSVLDGTCLPEKEVSYHDTWFECARTGTVETLVLMDSIGKDLINKNKLYITYGCRHYKEA